MNVPLASSRRASMAIFLPGLTVGESRIMETSVGMTPSSARDFLVRRSPLAILLISAAAAAFSSGPPKCSCFTDLFIEAVAMEIGREEVERRRRAVIGEKSWSGGAMAPLEKAFQGSSRRKRDYIYIVFFCAYNPVKYYNFVIIIISYIYF